jgi:hypothetical protein
LSFDGADPVDANTALAATAPVAAAAPNHVLRVKCMWENPYAKDDMEMGALHLSKG